MLVKSGSALAVLPTACLRNFRIFFQNLNSGFFQTFAHFVGKSENYKCVEKTLSLARPYQFLLSNTSFSDVLVSGKLLLTRFSLFESVFGSVFDFEKLGN